MMSDLESQNKDSTFEAFQRFKKLLLAAHLPGLALLFVAYVVAYFYFPEPLVRFALVWGYALGVFNIWTMTLLIGKLLSPGKALKKAIFSVLLVFKVFLLFGLIAAGYYLLKLNILAIAVGYLLMLFVVVLMNSLGYRASR